MQAYFAVKIFGKSFSWIVHNLCKPNDNDGFMDLILIFFFTRYVYLCKVL